MTPGEKKKREDKLIQILCDFYGVDPRKLYERKNYKNDLSKIKNFILYKLIKHWSYTPTEAGKVLDRKAWDGTWAVERIESHPELLDEFNAIIGDL